MSFRPLQQAELGGVIWAVTLIRLRDPQPGSPDGFGCRDRGGKEDSGKRVMRVETS